jgi:hypothetical protein
MNFWRVASNIFAVFSLLFVNFIFGEFTDSIRRERLRYSSGRKNPSLDGQ